MLTKTDLEQIGNVVKEIVRGEVKTEVKDSTRTIENQIRLSRMQVQNEINELDDRMKNVEIRVDGMAKDTKTVKKDVSYLKKTLDVFIDRTDREETKLEKRVTRVENHLSIPRI